ncbi:MAG: 3-carboxy-cis,cis-muconate cycloisomerase [Alphaproteobacteria bacterium]|nr:3-carboxy-cis,cis-muconate cycloisomerase [Rhizobiaceae bacterium]MBU3963666.1 3-carboxy-cis,cis-muconate cycloisomerase [Alphaproteobacteria bacterium]MBU4051309.1 3-carboxy-cis,cis-muconate cycloisomerase [Alphaproteobacteria bacterium]MBU4090608.1 3-carboxy-cis,cis-muconate cycloisomerase [Alphaproteobacteria bacterium]MBU4156065.1 3-carboxy-cis,cis-muconate cycloisomerase [Alphaproteobacteria bacterium]
MVLTFLPYNARLLGDAEITEMLGEEADIAAMLAFEVALARVEASQGLIDARHADAIGSAVGGFRPDLKRLAEAVLRDGVPVPDLIAQLREAIGGEAASALHFGATSQDVIDTALALKLKPVLALLQRRLGAVDKQLAALIERFASRPLMARTRMQSAIMITVGDRLDVWRGSISHLATALPALAERMLILSLAGAAGTAEKFGDSIGPVRALAVELGLGVPAHVPHTDRDRIADFASFLSRITGALGKMGMDIALMAQNGVDQIELSGGGGSSAMPHKRNPVLAEVLVTLARYNATQVAGLHQALVHEQERSGSAWTLEWLILPQMIEASGTALSHAAALLASVERIGEPG